ncbi:MAG: hypothetical protein M1828_003420 [Chrysothrix sp. TS-e1954]|nr:MAG: hypothetical protein M1828_003420 [Chrysothrix sp. TS-e1954]
MLDPRKFPRPPALEKLTKHLLVKWPGADGPVIAETRSAYWVLETHHPPTYYLPPSSLKATLTPTSRTSMCEWKGLATYFSIAPPSPLEGGSLTGAINAGKPVNDRAWAYPRPTDRFGEIKDHVSFYAGGVPWECYVDGERVEAQEGDFYGGWMTSEIGKEGVKGAPGTGWW